MSGTTKFGLIFSAILLLISILLLQYEYLEPRTISAILIIPSFIVIVSIIIKNEKNEKSK